MLKQALFLFLFLIILSFICCFLSVLTAMTRNNTSWNAYDSIGVACFLAASIVGIATAFLE